MTLLWILVGILGWLLIGAGVWAALDDKDRSWLRWYESCPPRIAWIAQPLVLAAWPCAIFVYLHRR